MLLAAAGTGLLLFAGNAFGQYGNNQGSGQSGMQESQWEDDEDWAGEESWDEEDMQAEMGLPMTFAGKGARIIITSINPNNGAMTGTVEFGGPKLNWTGQYPMDPNFDPSRGMTVNVATPQGREPLKIVDESETSARLTFEGKTYRVSIDGRYERLGGDVAGGVADDVEEVEDGPNPPAKNGDGPGSFGVGVVPHDTMPGWRVREVDPGSVAEMVGLQVGDIILGAVDGDGNPMAISPDKGFEAFKNVVSQWNFGLQVMREGENPPVFNVTVQRAGGAPPPQKEKENVQRADAGSNMGPASAETGFDRITLTKKTLRDPGSRDMES
ncbi:MAG: PDZ domain-containing protein, partial [Planctomycetota bacterium]